MNDKSIEFATAQVILAALTNSKELIIYEDPLKEIIRLCNETKKVIGQYSRCISGIPEDLPIDVHMNVGPDIYLRSVKNVWNKEETDVSPKEDRDYLIKEIMRDFTADKSYEKYVRKELTDESQAPYQFLIELQELSDQKRRDKLNEWSSYELVDLFEKVKESHKQLNCVGKRFNKFSKKFKDQEINNKSLIKIRNKHARRLESMFKEAKKSPIGYKGKGIPSYNYIRIKLLPYLVCNANQSKLTKDVEEEIMIYQAYQNIYNR